MIGGTSQRRAALALASFAGLRRRLTATVVTGAASQGALVISGTLVARSLGVTNRGHLALFQLIPLVLTVVGGAGLPFSLTYAIAARGRDATPILRQVRGIVALQVLVLTVVHLIIVLAVVDHSRSEVRTAGFISLTLVPSLLAQVYGQAILQGAQSFRTFNVARLLPSTVYAATTILAFAAGVRSLVAYTAIWCAAAGISGAAAVVLALWKQGPSLREDDATDVPSASQLLAFGLRGLLGSASPVETFQFDQIVVAAALSSTALGLYVVAVAFTNLPKLVAQSVGMVAYPDIASRPDREAARAQLLNYCWLTAGLVVIVAAALAVAAPAIVPLFFGHAFRKAAPIAQLLLVSALFLAVRRVVIDGSRGLGRAGLGTAAELVLLVTLIPLLAVFIPRWHVQGVAGALALASAVSLASALAALRWPDLRLPRATWPVAVATGKVAIPLFALLCLFAPLSHVRGGARTAVIALLAASVVVTTLYPLAVRIAARRFDLFEPILSANAILLALFGIRPIAMLLNGQQLDYDRAFLPNFVFATAVAALGAFAFVAAYEVSAPRWRDSRSGRVFLVRRRRGRVFALAATAASLALFVVFLASHGSIGASLHLVLAGRSRQLETLFSNSSEYLTSSPILGGCGAIVLALAAGPYLRARDRVLIVVCAAFPILYFFVVGGRRFLLPIVAIPIIVRYLARGRRPSWIAIAVVVPVAFLLLATIILTRSANDRSASGGITGILAHAAARPDEPVRMFFTGADTDMLPNFALEVRNLAKQGDYGLGRATLGDLVLAPIPHTLVPGKPTTARDRMLERVFGGPCQPSKGLCPDFSAMGTFYQDFWVPGVAAGMALLGLFSSWLWRRQRNRPRDPVRLMLVASWYVMLPILLRAGFNPAFSWFLYFVVPTYVGLRLALQIRPPAERLVSSTA